jgi:uncharacterized protein
MHLADGGPRFSAKDLINFLGCDHATALDLAALDGTIKAEEENGDPYLDLLKEKGLAHEQSHLAKLKAEGNTVREIPRVELAEMAELTRQAMRDGVDVIYQGALMNLPWHGYSDFLLKVPTPSKLGSWSYEVADTKLARTARPKHVIQLCLYSQMVALEQELMPEKGHVVLGDGSTFTFKLNDYVHYTSAALDRFSKAVIPSDARDLHLGTSRSLATLGMTTAEPCSHCDMCRWADRCNDEWDKVDHLSRVARLSSVQSRKLRAAGVTTLEALANMADGTTVPKVQAETLVRIRSQARLQYEKRTTGQNKVETLPLEERRGFARLPKPDAGDLFFDMEGDPVYSPDGSLEYLFGFHYEEKGKPTYKAFWARNRDEEKKAFEDALDFITARLSKYPGAFVYHYAAYEQTALRRLAKQYGTSKRKQDDELKRLAQAYGTRENEVDDLLRNRKLVDLYKVVREGIRVSEPSYSLKNLETFYAPKRTDAISSGGDSVVAFEHWLALGDDKLLKDIEDYNAFDCMSTKMCRDWLLGLRPTEVKWFDPEEEKSAEEQKKEAERREADVFILNMREQLVDGVPESERPWRELLGHLLEYHRREARREWWDFFKRLDARTEELIEDSECIGGLIIDRSVAPRQEKKSFVHTMRMPDQEFKLGEGSCVRADTGEGLEILRIDGDLVELKLGPSREPLVDGISLIPAGPINDTVQREAIQRYAQSVVDGKEGDYRALTSILRREKPRLRGNVILSAEGAKDLLSGTVDAVRRMDETHLVIQGPPGTGKTFTSAHAIVALLKDGKRVGVQAMTHKAINNLLKCVEEVAAKQRVAFKGAKKASDAEAKLNGSVIEDISDNRKILNGDYQLIGATAWFFARPELDRQLDYLFIDEAGQESLAKVVAAGASAKNIVLVGDQMQLSQPVKGAHPGGSGVSALEYLMKGFATVPPDRGILLSKTWRMHPDLCRFVSQAFYEGRLEPEASTAKQRILVGEEDTGLIPTGLAFLAVTHEENAQRSVEEANRVSALYQRLLGVDWINEKGEQHRLTAKDILIVSPYNMQVNLIADDLPAGARVGTVDKFQGQEGAVVLMSLAVSDGASAPRGIDFLYSPNRLNVGISRGRCAAIVVASPELAAASCRSVEQLKLANMMCWLINWSVRRTTPSSRSKVSAVA